MIVEIFLNFFRKDCQARCCTSECDDSFSAFLEEQDRKKGSDFKKAISNKLLYLSYFPLIYFLASTFMLIILLFIKYNNKINYNSDVKFGNLLLPSFFDLVMINPLVYKIYTCLATITGMIIVMTLFSICYQRFKVPEYRTHTIKLYVMTLFGTIFNLITFVRGFIPLVHYDQIMFHVSDSLKIELSQLVFIALIMFSVLFSIYSQNILHLLRLKQSVFPINNEENWYNFKLLIIFYLNVFTIIYVMFLLHENELITISIFSNFVEKNMIYVLVMFPYFIHVINAILVFSFYFEFKYLTKTLSQNLDVDYLFDESNRNYD
jgi:hypothetical protein